MMIVPVAELITGTINECAGMVKLADTPSDEIANQADIARRECITRARVTQVMGMLRLAPEIQGQILSMPDAVGRPPVTERILRPIGVIADQRDQLREFHKFLI